MGSMSPPKRVLLLTNSEHGQANVYLATAYALLTLEDEDVEVHFASFAPIRKFVETTSQHALQDNSRARPIIFHEIDGVDMMSAWSRPEIAEEQQDLDRQVNMFRIVNAIRRMQVLLKVTLPWTGPEFVQIFRSVTDIVQGVRSDIIAVDPAFSPALTALRHINEKFIILSPNTIKDFAMPLQPNGEALWKYPCVGKGFDYPVPWRLIPINIFLIFLTIIIGSIFDSHRRSIQRYVAEQADGAKLTTLNDLSLNPNLGIKFLVANREEIEFPLRVIPPHIIPCGPMIRPAKPVAEVDPDFAKWLARGPTLYINLGTHAALNERFAAEMATAIRIVLDHARSVLWRDKRLAGLQVLWKLTKEGEYEVLEPGSAIYKILGREIRKGTVRVVDWIEAEPTAVLETQTVICAVHHGGANSFLETLSAGIPQVVLPVWMDTFDFARRAELLGIGRWGNRLANKTCKGGELGPILIDVLLGGKASAYARRAKELAAICNEHGGGRVFAARHILAEIQEYHRREEQQAEAEEDSDCAKQEEKPLLNGKSNGALLREG
ncbi:hypothetical protein QBC46DRAFT_460426 [Diplogelasinospora grovesii]|uniref:Erythromycin biosynthesis protein CIII-like C-terminal domain-containing protein n=1 Tax=Diplogelasinospora grovesii TaxID=303347 RepID=A0AAN6N683_9PEZI|nr:hypothetical protein QBC46DRAFT_460426 [Diplogelasinospora grovesii]